MTTDRSNFNTEGEFRMAQTGKLKLDLLDVFGKRIKENVDIFMRQPSLGP